MEKAKRLYFETTGRKAADTMAAALADGKNCLVFWTTAADVVTVYDNDGRLAGREEEKHHTDAIEVWPTMTEKEIKNAHRIAAMRATLREKEQHAESLLQRAAELTRADRLELLGLVNIAYHNSGKIEGCSSVDSCASCAFCQKMIAAAACNPLMICGACYAAKDAYKEAAWRMHSLNARILSTVLFEKTELSTLQLTERCRFNEDGDTVNQIHAQNLLRIAETHQETKFGYWYKNAPAVAAGLQAEGITCRAELPSNVRFIHSSALIGFKTTELWFDDCTFTVYPDDATTAAAVRSGSHECNGKRCRACGYYCYLAERKPEPVNIAEYLRCGAEQRAVILAAYNAALARRSV